MRFDAIFDKRSVAAVLRADYKEWVIDKLREKRQTKAQQELAAYAVSLDFGLQRKFDNEPLRI